MIFSFCFNLLSSNHFLHHHHHQFDTRMVLRKTCCNLKLHPCMKYIFLFRNIFLASDITGYKPSSQEIGLLKQLEIADAQQWNVEQGLKYVTGYVAHHFKEKYPFLEDKSQMLVVTEEENYISILSREGLTHLSKVFLDAAKIMEQEFKKFHHKSLSSEKYIFKKVTKLVEKRVKNIPHEVLLCFIRTRTYIRLRALNNLICDENRKRKEKKLTKICNKK